jgi:hypothetical protein
MNQIKTNNKVASIALIATIPLLLFFQNCGQNGEINTTDSSSLAQTDSFIVEPAVLTDAPEVSSTPPALDMPVVAPPAARPPAVVAPPVVAPPVTGTPKPPVQVVAQEDKHHSSCKEHDNDKHDGQHSAQNNDSSKHDANSCADLAISDILLKVKSLGSDIKIVDLDKSISLDKLSLKIKALNSIKTKMLFLSLESEGNKVLSLENVVLELKTPSGQTAGLKVQLSSEYSLKSGQFYIIHFKIDPKEQLVNNAKKCIFKPVLRSASIYADDGSGEKMSEEKNQKENEDSKAKGKSNQNHKS